MEYFDCSDIDLTLKQESSEYRSFITSYPSCIKVEMEGQVFWANLGMFRSYLEEIWGMIKAFAFNGTVLVNNNPGEELKTISEEVFSIYKNVKDLPRLTKEQFYSLE